MKKMIPLLLCLFFASLSWAQNVTIIEAAGWFESAYVKWSQRVGLLAIMCIIAAQE